MQVNTTNSVINSNLRQIQDQVELFNQQLETIRQQQLENDNLLQNNRILSKLRQSVSAGRQPLGAVSDRRYDEVSEGSGQTYHIEDARQSPSLTLSTTGNSVQVGQQTHTVQMLRSLNAENIQQQQKVHLLDLQIRKMENLNQFQKDTIQDLSLEVESYKKQVNVLKQQLKQEQSSKLGQQSVDIEKLVELQQENNRLKQMVTQRDLEINQNKIQLQDLNHELNERKGLEIQLQKLQNEKDTLKGKVQDMQSELSKIQANQDISQQQIQNHYLKLLNEKDVELQGQLNKNEIMGQKCELCERKIAKLQKELQDTSADLQETQELLLQQKQQIKQQSSNDEIVQQLRNQIRVLNDQNRNKTNEMMELTEFYKKQIQKMQQSSETVVQKFLAQQKSYESCINKLQIDLDNARGGVSAGSALRQANQELSQQVLVLQETLKNKEQKCRIQQDEINRYRQQTQSSMQLLKQKEAHSAVQQQEAQKAAQGRVLSRQEQERLFEAEKQKQVQLYQERRMPK